MPEDSVGGGRVLLRIGLEHLHTLHDRQRPEFVALEPGVVWIGLEARESLSNGFETLRQASIALKLVELSSCCFRKQQRE